MCGGLWYVVSERMGCLMDYEELERKKERLAQMEQDFEDEFIYDSMALSGSTLTREEVKAVLAAVRRKESAEKETE